ncbi:MAG: plasmid pRiA4b ORF-3 family protein [Candidatus Binatia bacterium]
MRPSAKAHRPRADTLVHHFLVVLGETDPVVWRRIEVPERYSFWDLHVAIQDAMGWQDYHLHEFAVVHPKRKRLERIGIPDDEFMDEKPSLAGWKVRVSDYVHRSMPPMLYTYDFGDDWRHVLFYEETWSAEDSVSYPRCVAGARRCPPEDCGGTEGYRDFLAAVADRRHPEHEATLMWAGGTFDAGDFDPAAVRFDDPTERWKTAFGGD